MNSRGPRLIIIVLALGALALIGWYIWRPRPLGEIRSITGNGVIEATEVDVTSKVAGKVQTLNFHEGDDVQAGQLIATLEAQDLQGQVDAAQGNLQSAKESYQDLAAGTRPEDLARLRAQVNTATDQYSAASDQYKLAVAARALVYAGPRTEEIQQLRAAYKLAVAQRDLVYAGTRQQEIEQAKAALTQAQAVLTKAESDLKRFTELYADGAIAHQMLDQAQEQRDAAAGAVTAAQQKLDEAQQGARPQEKEAADQAVKQAQARLQQAENGARPQEKEQADAAMLAARGQMQAAQQQVQAAKAALDLGIAGATKHALDSAKGKVVQAQGALATAAATHQQAQIFAPTDGRVTLRNVEPGDLVTPGLPIVRLAELKTVWIRVYVPEEQIGLIKVGQRADIRTDAYTNKHYTGRVIEISQVPEFTPKNVQTEEERVKLVFGVKIEIENPAFELKQGMPGDATISVKN